MERYISNVIQALIQFGFIALVIERSLYQVFNTKLYKSLENKVDSAKGDFMDLKPWIAGAVCLFVAFEFRIDMLSVALGRPGIAQSGMILTGLFLAGGATGVYQTLKRARKMKEYALGSKADRTGAGPPRDRISGRS